MNEDHKDKEKLAEIGMRFNRFFRDRGYTGGQVAKLLNVNQNQITSMVNGTDVNLKYYMKIAECFPELNLCWLLTGEGEELRQGDNQHPLKAMITRWDHRYQQETSRPIPPSDKEAKRRVQYLKELLDEALMIRLALLGRLADVQHNILEGIE